MTAEIAILNRSAVALAADSALTVGGEGEKVYNSGNKLFTLSKYHPVGIMVYGNAEFMSVPWETIIKIYRASLDTTEFGALEEYADDFIRFLTTKAVKIIPETVQENYVRALAYSFFYNYLFDKIRGRWIEAKGRRADLPESLLKRLAAEVIEDELGEWSSLAFAPGFDAEALQGIQREYARAVRKSIQETFEEFPFSEKTKQKLALLVGNVIARNRETPHHAGVVIAGFGRDDVFPALVTHMIDGITLGKVKYKVGTKTRITFDMVASIVPLAQREMVATFIEGVDPNYRETKDTWLSSFLHELPKTVAESVPELGKRKQDALRKKLDEVLSSFFKEFTDTLASYRQEKHVDPIVDVVAAMPKEELSAVAEALVNLTALKRKVTRETETVGGPIDVAVISKGDGFVWIKRKHYFSRDINQHFLANYFRRVISDGC